MNICTYMFMSLTLHISTTTGTMHRAHHNPVCVISEDTIQQALNNPCTFGHAQRRSPRHAMEPVNVCFLQEGRIISSLQAMLSRFKQDYQLTRYDLQLLPSMPVDLPTRLHRNNNRTEYVRVLRSYYRELSCFSYAAGRSYVSMTRSHHQRMCTIVSTYLKPMLCFGTDVEEEHVDVDCSDWTSLIPDEIGLYGYKVVEYFLQFLQTLQPTCRVTLPL